MEAGTPLHCVVRGEHGNRSPCIVATYLDRAMAEEHVKLANEYVARWRESHEFAPVDASFPYDPFCDSFSFGGEYTVVCDFIASSPYSLLSQSEVMKDLFKEKGWLK